MLDKVESGSHNSVLQGQNDSQKLRIASRYSKLGVRKSPEHEAVVECDALVSVQVVRSEMLMYHQYFGEF